MKNNLIYSILLLILLLNSACSSTWSGVKEDSNKAWTKTKDTSKKAWTSSKKAIHEASE